MAPISIHGRVSPRPTPVPPQSFWLTTPCNWLTPFRACALRSARSVILNPSSCAEGSPGGRALATLEGHTSPVYGVALSADGRLLATGNWDGSVRLWAVPGGR